LEFIRELPSVKITSAPTEPIVLECELSRKPRDSVKWLKNGKALPSRLPSNITIDEKSGSTVHSISISKVTEEDLGEYTVQVESISSTGKLDMQVAPTLRLSENFEDTIVMKAGSSIVVEIPFVASPKPTVKWSWKPAKTGSQETTPRFKPDVAAGLTSLPIGKVKGEDAGDYSVKISNELGDVSVTVHLLVLDKPSPPRNPEVTENTGERVVFNWKEPEFKGDKPDAVLEYVVEMRESSMRVASPVATTKELSTPIEDLKIDKTYIFSVAAKNSVGQSDFVEAKPVSTKLDFGPPTQPKNVKAVVEPRKDTPDNQTVKLTWDFPSDVASPKAAPEFILEMKSKDSTRWQEIEMPSKVTETHCDIPAKKMKEYVDYEFRVTAVNKAGKSKPSEPSNAV
uniref:TITIN protein n=2 Tax=Hymenolepis diminuta TaxID=6216 RepID=A0A0R3SNC2_HYMDI